jgi:ABC-type branched-subunit amino acid transport system ATPase component
MPHTFLAVTGSTVLAGRGADLLDDEKVQRAYLG